MSNSQVVIALCFFFIGAILSYIIQATRSRDARMWYKVAISKQFRAIITDRDNPYLIEALTLLRKGTEELNAAQSKKGKVIQLAIQKDE